MEERRRAAERSMIKVRTSSGIYKIPKIAKNQSFEGLTINDRYEQNISPATTRTITPKRRTDSKLYFFFSAIGQ